MRVVTGAQMRKIDNTAIEAMGIKGLDLMENAGCAVYEEVMRMLSLDKGNDIGEPKVMVVCGPGNNGGDGYVAARYLNMSGIKTCIYSTVDPNNLKGDARENYLNCEGLPIDIIALDKGIDSDLGLSAFAAMSDDLGKSDLIIDALLGTGVNRTADLTTKLAIDMMNKCGKTTVSIDIPSGIGADDGKVYGSAVAATATVTFQAPKLGCVIYPGADYTGELIVRDIGLPEALVASLSDELELIERSDIEKILPKRQQNCHKGSFGKVLIIGGSLGMAGAAALSARGALRAGAGLVKIAVTRDILDVLQLLVPEATCFMHEAAMEGVNDFDAVVFGPGLGKESWIKGMLMEIISAYNGVLIIDADGLNALDDLAVLRNAKSRIILTPHPGEAARLLGCSTLEINDHRLASARQIALDSGAIAVLKGAASLIALPDGKIFINKTGNSGMATAGSGDVLSGIIAGLAGQGIAWQKAAQAGVYLHGLAGDMMIEQIGEYGLIASDLTVGTALAINAIINNQHE